MKIVEIGYTSLYHTCTSCSKITFVDAVANKYGFISQETLGYSSLKHSTIFCRHCGKSDLLQIGAFDTQRQIEEQVFSLTRDKIQRCSASIVIQRSYRSYLARLHGKAERIIYVIKHILDNHCASVIQSMYRMQKDVRRFKVWKAIQVIKNSPKHQVSYAINNKCYEKQVNWFESEEETRMLLLDYYTLVNRVGQNYGLRELEENAITISQRILDRTIVLAIKIQAHWRRTSTQIFFWKYRRECIQAFELMVNQTIKVQRSFRAWQGRRSYTVRKQKLYNQYLLVTYKSEREEKRQKEQIQFHKDQVRLLYRKEFKERQMAKFMDMQQAESYQHYSKRCSHAILKLLREVQS